MSKKIVLYPEVLASVLKYNEVDVFCMWLLSKQIDTQNNGIVEFKNLIEISKKSLGVSSNHIYKKILKGVDKYWRTPCVKNNKKILGLLSIEKIINRLEPNITRSMPVLVDPSIISNDDCTLKDIKDLFISIVAGRYIDNRPISVFSLSKNTGLSESTLINSLRQSPYIKKYENYKVIFSNSDKNALLSYMKNYNKSHCRIIEKNSLYFMIEQTGNSYILSDFERLPMKLRPRALKSNDKRMLDFIEESSYNKAQILSFSKN